MNLLGKVPNKFRTLTNFLLRLYCFINVAPAIDPFDNILSRSNLSQPLSIQFEGNIIVVLYIIGLVA